ncbi:MAG: hypothetical protein DLM59_01870 [Pseudonocardiales bacterium]|nr:MAG: hypothetical protein DLM56_05670 [Pseudonocardiales bacterium]PZS36041.1 MAG: hypothetical protein DLM59_01870 [Pseudonocardiales bacterium]
MPGGIKVTPEQLQALSAQCHQKAGDLQGTSEALRSQVQGVVGSDWSSTASAQFEQLHQKWQTSQKDMHEALTGIGRLLSNAGNAYSDSEGQISNMFKV